MQAVPSHDALATNLLGLSAGERRDPRQIAEWLVQHGYTRLDQVESPGDFALRGDILDIFPPAESDPYRIDFFDDAVEAIRRFDVSTQRSQETFQAIELPAVTASATVRSRRAAGFSPAGSSDGEAHREAASGSGNDIASFLAYLPADTIVVLDEPIEIQELGNTFWTRLNQPTGMMPVENLFRRAAPFTQLHLFSLPGGRAEAERFSFDVQSLARFETKTSEARRD